MLLPNTTLSLQCGSVYVQSWISKYELRQCCYQIQHCLSSVVQFMSSHEYLNELRQCCYQIQHCLSRVVQFYVQSWISKWTTTMLLPNTTLSLQCDSVYVQSWISKWTTTMLLPNTTLSLQCGSAYVQSWISKWTTTMLLSNRRDSVVFGSNIVVVHLDIHDWT
jgi:hypothetical protein